MIDKRERINKILLEITKNINLLATEIKASNSELDYLASTVNRLEKLNRGS